MTDGTVDDFVHLHLHSDMSQLDGCGKIPEYVEASKGRGHRAIAFTDHGTMRGYTKQREACKQHDLKAIYGIEFYVSPNMRRRGFSDDEKAEITKDLKRSEWRAAIKLAEERAGIRDRWHICAWAKDQEGIRNLFRLSSAAFIDGFYYKPRIDLDELIKHGDGLFVSTGCLSSPINDNWIGGKKRASLEFADRLSEAFGERLWLEVQPHELADQAIANRLMLKLRDRFGGRSKLLATQDAHYIHQEDWKHHEVLLCIGTNANLSDPNRFKFDGNDFHFKTRKEMWESFRKRHAFMPKELVKEALDSTLEFADACTAVVDADYHAVRLPAPDVPEKYAGNAPAYLRDLCLEGWHWRDIPRRARDLAARRGTTALALRNEYAERLKYELRTLVKQRFTPYFLMILDLYRFARGAGIMTGPGRGSVAGSLVAYLLGITSVDPIEHGLIFERFINPERVDMPDIDMDFEDRRRHEIVDYIRNKYGADKVCQVATIGKLSGKQCIRDVSRVLEVPLNEVNQVTHSIIERSSGDERASQTIEDSFKDFEVCREFNKKYPEVLFHAKRLEGMAKNLGIHAAAVVASPVPLTDLIPLEVRKHDGKDIVVSAVDMYGVAAAGLVKLDVLGLRTLTVIKQAIQMIESRHGRKIDMENPDDVDLNDPKVLAGFTSHEYGGIFQYDTPGADKVCSGVEFTSFEDVAAMTALNRPGTSRSGLATKYVERKKNPKLVEKVDFHPEVSRITADTLGILVYQEHVIRIFTDIAGFAPGTADSLRKVIAKKIGDETIGKERENFIRGAMAKTPGMTKEVAGRIIDAITFFGCIPHDSMVATPAGPRRIDALGVGDEVFSHSSGNLVRNRIKAIGPTGTKTVYRIRAGDTQGTATARHWWQLSDGTYRQTLDLKPGDRLSFVTRLNLEAAEKRCLLDGVREAAHGSGVVWPLLPTPVPCEADGNGQSSRFRAQQVGRRSGEGVEGRIGQASSGSSGAIGGDSGREQPGVRGRFDRRVSQDESQAFGQRKGVPEVRSTAYLAPSCPEYACSPRSPQGSGQEEQRFVEFGSYLPEVPQQGAPSGEDGRASEAIVKSVELVGEAVTFDLECEGEPHNYVLADGLTSHNSYGFNKSHATAYGMIAFWSMWLKTYYPLEFYWSLLSNEPDRIRVQQIAKDAKRHGIELKPPHVSSSGLHFTIDASGAIRGSLVDIKGVGEAASASIIEAQPFTDMFDFLDRVQRRKCHKGVVLALAKAGALDGLVPNARWFVENIEEFWKAYGGKKADKEAIRARVTESASAPDYSEEERTLLSSSVNPLAFGKHPIDAYEGFINRSVRVPIVDMSSETFFQDHDGKGVWIAGVVVEVKYNQVGDFHTGALPSEEERKRMFWGHRYANVNIEDKGGKQNRVKFDFDIFDTFRPVIDKGIGTPVVVHATPFAFTGTLRAHFAIDLQAYRTKIKAGDELDIWESVLCRRHPARLYHWKDDAARKRRITNSAFWANPRGGTYVGLVTHVRLKYDRRGGIMAWFGLLAGDNKYIEVMCFASTWMIARRAIKPGRLLMLDVERQPDTFRKKGWAYFFNGGRIKVLSKPATGAPE